MKIIKRIGLTLLLCLLVTATTAIVVQAAYFAKGKFKDVFVNQKEYFSSDILYSIPTIDSQKQVIGSSGAQRNIAIYNHDPQTGDFDAFDVLFNVYAWVEGDLPAGKVYTLSHVDNGVRTEIPITSAEHSSPVIVDKTLKGGKCSTETLTVTFCYAEGEDVADAPGIHVVVVPTTPKRLSSYILGSTVKPTWSESYSVSGKFDEPGKVEDCAAFTYKVHQVGLAPEGSKITIKWNSQALTLMTRNGSVSTGNVQEISEDGFDKKMEWTAQSNYTDVFVFFRNIAHDMWKGTVTWQEIEALIKIEYTKGTQE